MKASLRTITPAIARLEKYSEITTQINPRTEADIFRSLETQLESVDAVWIQHPNGTMSAARRTSELAIEPPRAKRDLLALESLITSDDRRERVTIATQQAFRASITPPAPAPFDEIDELVEEIRSINFQEKGAAL